jgi:lipooligosaccharide transport system ATP-binding protein
LDAVISENLVKRYNGLTAVKGINFRIRSGECFGFLGPNGAGKTTTMRMIQCVSPPTSGRLTVFGIDVLSNPRAIKRDLGVCPQEANLDPDLTSFENLVYYASFFDVPKVEAKRRAESLLDFFQLQAKRDTRIDELSGGMKRRLLLARAMINNPKLLILDEPTVGLDPQARHMIWDQLSLLRSRGLTIILTTHYMEEAAKLCDRLVIMDNGLILDSGSPAELIKRHVGESIVEVKDSASVRACLQELSDESKYEVAGDKLLIPTSRPKEIMSAILADCGVVPTTIRPATLEDVFLRLTGRQLRE